MICTFFGHRDTPKCVEDKLRHVLLDLINSKNVTTFYIGNQGAFDFKQQAIKKGKTVIELSETDI
ncbi:MAG: hypothetical protein IKV36_05315 [Clostridia bacterium]|nr:hypothetical protein [Clostridia bacterium]